MISLMPNTSLVIKLEPAERAELEKWESSYGTPQQVALRCRIILGALAGQDNVAIAEQLGVSRPTVQLWRKRVSDQGIGQVWEIAPGRGRKPQYDQATRDKIIQATLRSKPKGMTHWSCRLIAALNVLDGKVIGECHGRHRHQEWLKFLRRLDREFPKGVQLHLVMDNYGTHKEPHVKAWLKKHPRFVCHFVPTSSSWLNLVERWFRELTEKAIRRGSFLSVPDLKQAIEKFMEAWNENPKPFVWTATVEDIIKKIDRARAKAEQIKPGSTLPRGKKKAASL